MKRILVTGSSGFVGQNLVKRLEKQLDKYEIIKYDRKSPKEYIKVDTVFHLAAYGNRHTQTDIDEIYKANVNLLLDLLRNVKYERFINVGTSSEYGTKDRPMREDDLLEPETFYAASKAAGTLASQVFAKQRDENIVTIRPFSLYGPGEGDHKFIPILTRAVFSHKPVKIAPGVHDWIHIDDFIDAMLLVAREADSLSGEIFNVGTGIQHTNKEVVRLVENVSTFILDKHFTDEKMRDYDTQKSWVADITKIKKLGWEPKIDLEEGIRRYLDWYTPPGV